MIFELGDQPQLVQLNGHTSDKKGTLFALEDVELGLPIKRVFFITDFTNQKVFNNRGNHSHVNSSQFIINIKGEVQIKLVNVFDLKEYNFVLNKPNSCLYLPANFHIFMNHYSEDAVMLVLCDKNFDSDEVHPYLIPETLDGFRDAAQYLDITLKKIIDNYNELHKQFSHRMKFKNLSEIEFNERFCDIQPNAEELIEFYRYTDNYILELTEYHSTHARRYMTSEIAKRIRHYNLDNVLDYGCGIGEDSIALLDNGFNTTLCDIAGKTFDFAKWRVGKRRYFPDIIEIYSEDQHYLFDNKQFEAVLCLEVLMHVPDPIKTLKLLYSHLKINGFLFLTHRFTGNYSLALEQNQHFEQNIDHILFEVGFSLVEKIFVWEGKDVCVYKK